jgi:hypothetical protein
MKDSNGQAGWSEHITVDEGRLKDYLARKQHGPLLANLPVYLQKTLSPAPTSQSHDGGLHFGDSLMLLSHCTECLLQADVSDQELIVDHTHSQKKEFNAISLTTGKVLYSCPRNIFSICRVNDNDGYDSNPAVHYGQPIRISINTYLSDKVMYLYVSDVEAAKERRALLFPRPAKWTLWRIIPQNQEKLAEMTGQPVLINEPICLESIDTGCLLMSDHVTYVNRYGNEFRAFAEPKRAHCETGIWSFVDESWTQAVLAAARREGAGDEAEGDVFAVPTTDILEHPEQAASQELDSLSADMATASYSVCQRIFPMLRARGMHGVRKTRRMCFGADINRDGSVPVRTFEGILAYMSVRLSQEELVKIQELFSPAPDSDMVDYLRFFRLMELKMPEVRLQALRDAYKKLSGKAKGAMVNITDIQEHWSPSCYPEVQSGEWPESEAYQDFLRQWEVHSADGSVSPADFLDYYRDVSMAIESNAVFVEMVRRAWDL